MVNILLLEGDFRTADTFVAFGASDMEAWSQRRHVIDDEPSILRELARVMLSIRNVRLIQTKDEQESLRAVAAYGLLAAFSSHATHSEEIPVFGSINTEKVRLSDRLVAGGIPWELAKTVSEEVGSIPALQRLYSEGETQECKDQLLIPLVSSFCERYDGNASRWSTAIHSVFCSESPDVSTIKKTFAEYKHFVTDEARLLTLLYRGTAVQEAIDSIFSSNQEDVSTPRRLVRIELAPEFKDCFPEGNVEGAFYRLREVSQSGIKLPRVRLWTDGINFRSEFVDLTLMDGVPFVEIVTDAVQSQSNSLAAARHAAARILVKIPDRRVKTVFMIRGLRPALVRVAKAAGYRPETRLLVDMVLAELSLSHGIIIFQAVRKTGDMESFVREFALTCFHYQLLTRKKARLA